MSPITSGHAVDDISSLPKRLRIVDSFYKQKLIEGVGSGNQGKLLRQATLIEDEFLTTVIVGALLCNNYRVGKCRKDQL